MEYMPLLSQQHLVPFHSRSLAERYPMKTLLSLRQHAKKKDGITALLRDAVEAFKSEGTIPDETQQVAWRRLDAKYRHKSMAWKAVFQELADRQLRVKYAREVRARMEAKRAIDETAIWETLKTLRHLEDEGVIPEGTFDQAFSRSKIGEVTSTRAAKHLGDKQ